MDICAVVLCGGKSTRMGTNKALLPINDKPVIEHIIHKLRKLTDEIILITNDKEAYEYLQLPMYRDRFDDAGPLAGIESAMYHVHAEKYMFVACDMPFIQADVYKYLVQTIAHHDAVVPIFEGRVHPLASIYKRTALPIIQEKLLKDDLRVRSFYDEIDIKYVDKFPNVDKKTIEQHFFNMNNPEQYEQAKEIFD
ncbi:MAG TPA: molybdenum cofactor guanylyltransferase [Bacillota bacterium]|nr:molybdenum cofactor guanylyltransferase [Bacillota bacterium]